MNRNRLLAAAAVVCLSALLPAAGYAQTHTANLTVTASVSANCRLTAGTLAFGAYDPVVANASAHLDGSGTFTVACTRGATAWVGMDAGANASGSVRRMQAGTSGNYLTYELYREAGRTNVWGGTQVTGVSYTAASKTPFTLTVFGRVAQNQDVPAGSYTDTVVMTVNF